MANIKVQGHRGARAVLPENTIPAFDYALNIGVDVLELDLGVTKDNILIVAHDPKVNFQICSHPDANKYAEEPVIHELTLKQLKEFDCGSKKNARFPKQKPIPNTKIPTLTEVFDLVLSSKAKVAKTVEFNIETKIRPDEPQLTTTPEKFAQLVVDAIQKYKLESRVVVQSFDPRTLIHVRKLNPSIRLSMLMSERNPQLLELSKKQQFEFISPKHTELDQSFMKELKASGFKVAPWTANTPASWKRLVSLGVDEIITDDPEALIQYLKRIDNASQKSVP